MPFLYLLSYKNLISSIFQKKNCPLRTVSLPTSPPPNLPTTQQHPTAPPGGQQGASLTPHLHQLSLSFSGNVLSHLVIHSLTHSFTCSFNHFLLVNSEAPGIVDTGGPDMNRYGSCGSHNSVKKQKDKYLIIIVTGLHHSRSVHTVPGKEPEAYLSCS